jgi:hypothetical protein
VVQPQRASFRFDELRQRQHARYNNAETDFGENAQPHPCGVVGYVRVSLVHAKQEYYDPNVGNTRPDLLASAEGGYIRALPTGHQWRLAY